MQPQTFIFMSKSGSGKGTQAELLIKYLKSKSENPVFYLETGEKFRELISQSGYTAKLSKQTMLSGKLQPAFLPVHIWAHLFIEQMEPDKHVVIDGTPRMLDEAKILDGAFKFYERKNINVVFIDVSDKWATDRLMSRGRADDKSLDEIKKRLDWFQTSVVPAIEFYKSNPDYNLISVNGEQTIEQVYEEMIRKIGL